MNDLEYNIADCCIICLERKPETINLRENFGKLNDLSLLCNYEFADYTKYSQHLCTLCDEKLSSSVSFLQNILRTIQLLDNYKLKYETKDNLVRKLTADTIKIVPLEEANKVIEEFRKIINERKDCLCCDFTGTNRRSLSAHMMNAHRDKRNIWCRDCNQFFEDIDDHKKIHIGKHTCPFCGKKKNSSHFVEHIQSHTGKFECNICDKKFNSESWLGKHKLIHTEDRPFQCPNCKRGFIQITSLRYHLKTHGKFSCDVCKKHFKTEAAIHSHECIESDQNAIVEYEKSMISDDVNSDDQKDEVELRKSEISLKKQEINDSLPKEYECELCQKTFVNGYRFRLHVRQHKGTLPYKCPYCHKKMADKTTLLNHKRVHTKEKPFECIVCKKMFSQKSTLATHMKCHTGRPEVCDICGKTFCRRAELKIHLSKHIGEKPFLCTKCGKAFAQNSHLTEHMVGHEEARPYKCSFCDKAFKKNSVLKSHLKLHMENKPFQCTTCSYSCYTAYRLQQHMTKLHHKILEDNPSIKLEKVPVAEGKNATSIEIS